MLPLMLSAVLMCGGWQHVTIEEVQPTAALAACTSDHTLTMWIMPTANLRTGQVWPDTARLRSLHDQRNRFRRAPAGDLTL